MGTYINGTGCVSPQRSWDSISFLEHPAGQEGRILWCQEPQVDPGLDDKYLRRMSRMIRLGWLAAKICTDDAGGQRPDAIITGSGWGSVLDSEKFLLSLFKNKENFLPPTPFIQSTHNAVGAQVAMLMKSYHYNMAYAHGSFAFEQALLDGMMRLESGESGNVLAGGFDEITANQFTLMERLGSWRKQPVSSLRLFDQEGEGTLAGEGFAFFILQDHPGAHVYAEIKQVETIFGEDLQAAEPQIRSRLDGIRPDLVIAGMNGDRKTDEIYRKVLQGLLPEGTRVARYKHLCGEYHTASAFAMWIAAKIIRDNHVPETLFPGTDLRPSGINSILIYNHHKGERHSFILLSRPGSGNTDL